MKNMSLQRILRDADERVRQAAADALNVAAEQLEHDIDANMSAQGIKNRTGKLRASVKATKATAKRLNALIKSEVYAKVPRRPGSRNPAMRGRYKNGVPYGRIIEFSPRINKPFFYTAWYKNKQQIKENVMNAIGNAWSGKQ